MGRKEGSGAPKEPTAKQRMTDAGVELFTVKKSGVAHWQGYAPLELLKEMFERPGRAADGFHSWHWRGVTYYYEIATSQIFFRK